MHAGAPSLEPYALSVKPSARLASEGDADGVGVLRHNELRHVRAGLGGRHAAPHARRLCAHLRGRPTLRLGARQRAFVSGPVAASYKQPS